MKKIALVGFCLLLASVLSAQAFNTVLRDVLDYPQDLNDVWGYAAPDGTEYALVGTRTGLSIVTLADPDNISEVAFISGDASTWRDMKTYNDYAYVVADSGNDGLLIVDLSNLPGPVTHQYFNVPVNGGQLEQAHNIFIDTINGLAYLAGGNLNNGGMIILDIASVPGQASLAALGPNTYAHDVFVQDDRMYASEIFVGDLTIYDVADINNITEIGSTETPFTFTHNAWTTADGNYVFTTDERANAPVAAYDITDPTDPQLIDEYRPARSIGAGAIPHNTHVLNEYLITSSYTDGVEIVDASVPDNLVSVAYYDTWSGADGGFNGSWGAYPFLPSGLVLASDIDNGLFVIEATYQRAARIEGTVTEDNFGGPALNNVAVDITNPDGTTTTTNAAGFYRAGFPGSGTYTVTFSLPGYTDVTKSIDFVGGTEIQFDTFMVVDLSNQSAVTADVISSTDNSPLEVAELRLIGPDASYTDLSDINGDFDLGNVIHDAYEVNIGKWGYENEQSVEVINAPVNLSFVLDEGYLDGFNVDQGWTASDDGVTSGRWIRGVPIGTTLDGDQANPGSDANTLTDVGTTAYVTGNGGGTAGTDDIDGGTVTLTSPVIDLTFFANVDEVTISYDYWFYRGGGSNASTDEMTVSLSNGSTEEVIATYTAITNAWINVEYNLADLSIPLTSNTLQVIVRAEDINGGHVVEAGFDDFRVFVNPALPVELATFTARPQGSMAMLNWVTTQEANNAGFAIERSTNGRSFSEIGWVAGRGNSQGEATYQFLDTRPAPNTNFYRLRQVDVDGTTSYSEVRQVNFADQPTDIVAYPNPTEGLLWLNIEESEQISVFSINGRLLIQQQLAAGQPLDLRDLATGQYLVRIAGKTIQVMKK